jgi:hypothetical protein
MAELVRHGYREGEALDLLAKARDSPHKSPLRPGDVISCSHGLYTLLLADTGMAIDREGTRDG